MKEQYQSVIITLSNGKQGIFIGKVLAEEDELLTIKDIKFTRPEDLPEDCHFDSLD